jgi:hypothetical protein
MGEGAVGNCPPLLWKVEDGKTNLPTPPLFGIKFKKKSFFYYISMQAYIVQIANGIRVCFETLVTVLLPPNPVMEIFTQAFWSWLTLLQQNLDPL